MEASAIVGHLGDQVTVFGPQGYADTTRSRMTAGIRERLTEYANQLRLRLFWKRRGKAVSDQKLYATAGRSLLVQLYKRAQKIEESHLMIHSEM